ncbi:serine phosphatase RsbU, regulator of sigma subunit [Synechococcus sp. PCC 7502]|uniref:PP2C family protein-serine/threonine phosphatase n=1 Tax=Synechococcus sp. PCC 7502 TaxID=1173263 RepID=UPI00029FAFD6|nr:SpoIIE family protein phosphatase [Synechococcus sp. PCC 7502]AFY72467.1 serine phosphatase RsbU, regulator of sigma subunit [Synechococcus sp. PCC 7502]
MLQVLVIDDDPVMRMILKNALQEQGYLVILAKDGQEGIDLAKKHHPALVICDWLMPKVDGLEVCLQVKQEPSLYYTFFILLTSRSAVEDKVQALNHGADDFLSKPIDKMELIASVRAGLRLYQLNQDLQLQKQLLVAELNEASEYVRSLLPKSLDHNVKIRTEFLPSSQLGGDCYDFYWLDPDHLAIYLIDTSGHGVGSALLSISILNLLRSQSFGKDKFYDPKIVMTELNRAFQMSQQGGRYFTMWYGVYQQSERKLVYANAGHPTPIVISGNHDNLKIKQLPSLSIPIGFFPDAEYTSAELLIDRNTSLYIFSDGIFEVMQETGRIWGLANLIKLLTNELPLSQNITGQNFTAEWVREHIRKETPDADFSDDVSLVHINFP